MNLAEICLQMNAEMPHGNDSVVEILSSMVAGATMAPDTMKMLRLIEDKITDLADIFAV